jgi:hypothetical protein
MPDTRPYWDEMPLRGHLFTARALARAVVDLRGGLRNLRRLDVPPPDTVRALLHHRFAAELAVGLEGAGRPEGAAQGHPDRAEALARSAIDVDPWAEHAHAVLVAAALARGDRAAARAALQRCEAALSELGVEPSDETRRLARQAGGGRSAAGA